MLLLLKGCKDENKNVAQTSTIKKSSGLDSQHCSSFENTLTEESEDMQFKYPTAGHGCLCDCSDTSVNIVALYICCQT